AHRTGRARVRRTVDRRGTRGVEPQPGRAGRARAGGQDRGRVPVARPAQPLLRPGGQIGDAGYARSAHRDGAGGAARVGGALLDPTRITEDIERARRTYGGRNWPSTFADRLTAPLPGFRDVARIMRSGGFGVKDLSPVSSIPVSTVDSLPEVHSGQIAVTWVGH